MLTWTFPLPRCTAGVLMGDGTLGVMVWGGDDLRLTVARAGFWDHRGGMPGLHPECTWPVLRRLIAAQDEDGLRALFAEPRAPGRPPRPYQLGGGTLRLALRPGWRVREAALDVHTGILVVCLASGGDLVRWTVTALRGHESVLVEGDWLPLAGVGLSSAWERCRRTLEPWSVPEPATWSGDDGGGFLQSLPEDPPLAVAWRRRDGRLLLATALGDDARAEAERRTGADPRASRAASILRMAESAGRAPRLELPDPALQRAWDYGLWLQEGLTAADGVPATLQGPWMEDTGLPMWSNDYHLNVNLQFIYAPALATGRWSHLDRLWAWLMALEPQMRARGRQLFGDAQALMVPHAIDDRGTIIGNYWAGTIDHGCCAWLADLAMQHWRYGGERRVLEQVAWPLLTGAFAGFSAMAERRDGRLSLPVSSSPEYRDQRGRKAWRDASYQLAAWHRVARDLGEAAAALGRPADPRWAEVERDLPAFTVVEGTAHFDRSRRVPKIGVWEGTDLEECHRHHSHLAAIWPFCTIDPCAADAATRELLDRTLAWWSAQGMGGWTGWCVPWAAAIALRCGNADGAVAWLRWWESCYTNLGGNGLHNGDHPGAGFANRAWDLGHGAPPADEIMELDGPMAAMAALAELFVQDRDGVLHILPSLPRAWPAFACRGLHAPGGFRIDAEVAGRRTVRIAVESLRGGRLRLRHRLGPGWTVDGAPGQGEGLDIATAAGQRIVLACA